MYWAFVLYFKKQKEVSKCLNLWFGSQVRKNEQVTMWQQILYQQLYLMNIQIINSDNHTAGSESIPCRPLESK